jgi:hypothetical protein
MCINQSIPTIHNQRQSYKQDARDLHEEEVKREVAVQVMPLTVLWRHLNISCQKHISTLKIKHKLKLILVGGGL